MYMADCRDNCLPEEENSKKNTFIHQKNTHRNVYLHIRRIIRAL